MDRSADRVLDEYLVLLSQDGSAASLEQLVGRWTPRLARYTAASLGTSDTADVVQDIWASAIRTLWRLEDPARFPAWIYAIATRKCTDAVRANIRHRRRHARAEQEVALTVATDPAADIHDRLDLAHAIARLPAEQQSVVRLHYVEDLGIDEIAAVLSVPSGTVKSRLHHARNALRHICNGET